MTAEGLGRKGVVPAAPSDRSPARSKFGPILFGAGLNTAIWVGAIALECAVTGVEASALALAGCGALVMAVGTFGLAVVTTDRR